MNIFAYTKPGYVINYDVQKMVCILLSRSKNSIFARPKWPKSYPKWPKSSLLTKFRQWGSKSSLLTNFVNFGEWRISQCLYMWLFWLCFMFLDTRTCMYLLHAWTLNANKYIHYVEISHQECQYVFLRPNLHLMLRRISQCYILL